MYRSSHNKSAFTLLELLVCVSVLVIIIAILIPTIGMAREQSRTTVCQSKLRQFGTALNAYYTEYQGALPPWYWSKPLMLYMASSPDPNNPDDAPVATYKFQRCPSITIPLKNSRGITYAGNVNVFNTSSTRPPNIGRFRRPGQIVAVGDINQVYADGGGWWHFDWSDWEGDATWTPATGTTTIPVGADASGPLALGNTDSDGKTDVSGSKVSGLRYRHGWNKSPTKGIANVLMLDAHVESVNGGELQQRNLIAKKY